MTEPTAEPDTQSRPKGLAWVVVLIVALVVGAAVVVAVLVFPSLGRTPVSATRDADATARVEIEADNGPIDVVRSDDGRIHAWLEGFSFLTNAELSVHQDGETTRIEVRCPWVPLSFCAVRLRVELSEDSRLEVVGRNGAISIDRLSGDITAHTENGGITVDRPGGDLDLRTTNGTIRVTSATSGTVDSESVNGAVELSFSAEPDSVRAVTTNGSVTVELPDRGPYSIEADTVNGTTDVDRVIDDPGSDRSILARTVNGRVEVRGECCRDDGSG